MENDLIIVLSVIIVTYLTFHSEKEKNIESMTAGGLLNLYDQELQPCPDNESESSGSWDGNKKCSELDGGVHQICYRDIGTNANEFSKNTGQNDWSTGRGDENHCVCLGAWSLYKKQIDEGIIEDNAKSRLKCDAIPKIAFSIDYVDKFSTWNGNELSGQIINGVEGIVEECEKDTDDETKKTKLIDNYCNFADQVDELKFKKNESGELTSEFNEFYKSKCQK